MTASRQSKNGSVPEALVLKWPDMAFVYFPKWSKYDRWGRELALNSIMNMNKMFCFYASKDWKQVGQI